MCYIFDELFNLWDKVNKKYGDHVYTLGVNGLNQAVLSKSYTEDIATGYKAVKAKLKELLK